MTSRFHSVVTASLLAAGALLLYGWDAGRRPFPQAPEEEALAVTARSIATSGADLSGRLLPLLPHAEGDAWLQPVPAYATALVFATGRRADLAARWPSAIIGALNVALVYLLARRVMGRERSALIAGAMLLLAPAHFAYSRAAVDAVYPVPFALAWALLLVEFLVRPRNWLLPVAMLCLGAGVYTQPSAPLTMAAYAAVTGLALWRAGHRSARLYLSGAAGFAMPLVALAVWYAAHPETYQDTMGRWAIHAAHIRSPLDGLRAFLNWNTLSSRTALYWDFFNPAWLFFSSSPEAARGILRGAAPLALPMLALVPVGVVRLGTGPVGVATVILGGLICAPLAAASFAEPHPLNRALSSVPFIGLLAAAGAVGLLESPRVGVRWAAVALLALLPLQFLQFYLSY